MSALRAAVVRVVRLVVHHQLIVHKVEAVGLRLIRVQDHLTDCEQAQKNMREDIIEGVRKYAMCPPVFGRFTDMNNIHRNDPKASQQFRLPAAPLWQQE